ncbi:MAG: di-trans,poly-cis-decaprenylcistransferase [Elusimicrobiota bacterium]|jgi:undecaprenyl diphosphate synthase|nr:di-trans,poly-cis-decaprenylcistransferase [Elusimicrobiota bacterium]
MQKNLKIPLHIAFIMDGNGRWAKARGFARAKGHKEGAASVEAIIKIARQIGIKYITLFAFSTENWQRPPCEIKALMKLLENVLDKYSSKNNSDVRLLFSGRRDRLPKTILEKMDKIISSTANNRLLTLNLALNYGARQEIADAVNKLVASGKVKISEDDINSNLYNNIPQPDLIIRTSGEKRLSNFMLWQSAYSELYFTDTLWPDFREKELLAAVEEYSRRERRFGK